MFPLWTGRVAAPRGAACRGGVGGAWAGLRGRTQGLRTQGLRTQGLRMHTRRSANHSASQRGGQ